ncbi:unnamed protein product [Symbiodinium natans]|uniref:LamG-like jellyroll fold domain-containing protein n=1 Tax=Symbiodinium natans TaxID=878477 RepID=A0A812JAA8_9DINO|nr:unnamed protein product [Symbiodinium natans]
MNRDADRIQECGFRTVVKPRTSNFPSPLTLYDEVSTEEENPIGMSIWNMTMSVYKARKPDDPDPDAVTDDVGEHDESSEESDDSSDVDEEESKEALRELARQAEAPTLEDLSIGDRVLVRKFLRATVTGLRSTTFPWGVEVTHADGSRKHYLPSELIKIHGSASASSAAQRPPERLNLEDASRYALRMEKAGPWSFAGNTLEDTPHTDSANPESFVVSLSARCDGGRGFRSPVTSRDATPPSGYILYADGEDRWAFWVGDGMYWSGVQGSPVIRGRWTSLQGVYDATARSVSLFVDGECVGVRYGVAFVTNKKCPLRIGAGRSESETGRYFFEGAIRDLKVYAILAQDESDA